MSIIIESIMGLIYWRTGTHVTQLMRRVTGVTLRFVCNRNGVSSSRHYQPLEVLNLPISSPNAIIPTQHVKNQSISNSYDMCKENPFSKHSCQRTPFYFLSWLSFHRSSPPNCILLVPCITNVFSNAGHLYSINDVFQTSKWYLKLLVYRALNLYYR